MAESLASTQLQQFRDKYGIIEKVSDRGYFTNSFHCHVSADISPFEKQDMEYELFHKINGGHIQYVRLDEARNTKAIESIIKRGMEMGFYQGVNFELVSCKDCGNRSSGITETCPACGSHDLAIIVRICGYLGFYSINGNTRLNDGKMEETKDRRSM